MQLYNKIMLYFWLFAAILIFLVVTFKGFQEDFKIWGYYYTFSGLALLMFFARRFMMRRMIKHLKYMEEQEAKEK
jgi:hypothetical protein